jgi:hypothetical protein
VTRSGSLTDQLYRLRRASATALAERRGPRTLIRYPVDWGERGAPGLKFRVGRAWTVNLSELVPV